MLTPKGVTYRVFSRGAAEYFVTSAKEVMCLEQFLSVCVLGKTYQPDFHDTWWKGAARTKEEPVKV